MASLIPGYEYDVFISYRQKDNKGDRWVSEFVKALRTELEATFKEDISIFFDENPKDGLLETHIVEDSLKQKLKCLIFIPIISQTYCDSKCYAWQYEFCLFNRMAKEDHFGRDIKLTGGNVSSRILPVKIHDLDQEDTTLLENETGSVLRSIEFIYKSPGVNRPLRANEDHPQDNLNNTYYRDQINKVANAVKEIITALTKSDHKTAEAKQQRYKTKSQKSLISKTNIIEGSLLSLTLIILGFFLIPKLCRFSQEIEKSIAVLPFVNLGSDEDKTWFNDGITDVITNQLSKISGLRILGWTSTQKYKEEKKTITEIGDELGVNYVIAGSVQRQGDKMRISVELIRVLNEDHIWSDIYDRDWKDIFNVQSDIAQRIAEGLKTVLTPEEKIQIEKAPTNNPEAYNSYLQGRFFWNKRNEESLKKSIEYFSQSIKVDPDYALAYAGLADAYYILAWWGWYPRREGYTIAKEYALRALSIDKNLADAHATLGSLYCWSDWKWEDAAKELKLATELNPNCANAHQYYSELLDIISDNKAAREQIDKALELDPFSTAINATSALYFYNAGKFSESVNAYNKTLEINPDFSFAYIMLFDVHISQGDDAKAAETIQKYMLSDTLTMPVAGILKDVYNKSGKNGLLTWLIEWQRNNPTADLYLAKWNAMLGRKKEALRYLEKMVMMHFTENSQIDNLPDEIPRINNSPAFDNLRTEPEFQAIIMKMGLSEHSNQ